MSRRNFAPGKVFHVFNRSIEGKEIFPCKDDRWRLIQAIYFFNDEKGFCNLFHELEKRKDLSPFEIIREHAKEVSTTPLVSVIAYCLKDDGFHLLLEEKKKGGISKFMQRLTTGYTKYFNNRYKRRGPLFEGKFKDREVKQREDFKRLLVYINVIAPGKNWSPESLVDFAREYLWSTHQDYINQRKEVVIDKAKAKEIFPSPKEYLSFVNEVVYRRKEKVKQPLYEKEYKKQNSYF